MRRLLVAVDDVHGVALDTGGAQVKRYAVTLHAARRRNRHRHEGVARCRLYPSLDLGLYLLVRLAITAKCAADAGWPHLATAAARECKVLVDRLVVELSPACSTVSVDVELDDVGTAGTLPAALARLYGRALVEGIGTGHG